MADRWNTHLVFFGPVTDMVVSTGAQWALEGLGVNHGLASQITTIPFQLLAQMSAGIPVLKMVENTVCVNLPPHLHDKVETLFGRESLGYFAINMLDRKALGSLSAKLVKDGQSASDAARSYNMLENIFLVATQSNPWAAASDAAKPLDDMVAHVTTPLSEMLDYAENAVGSLIQHGVPAKPRSRDR